MLSLHPYGLAVPSVLIQNSSLSTEVCTQCRAICMMINFLYNNHFHRHNRMVRPIEMPIEKVTSIVIYLKAMATYAFVQLAFSFTNIYKPTKRTHYTIDKIRCFAIKILETPGTITLIC